MVNYITMLVVNIFEAKAKLSEFLEIAARGERVLICKRNRPVAELRAVESARTEPRPIGRGRGRLVVPDAFFEPLPDDVIGGFEGAPAERRSRVAEGPPGKASGFSPRDPTEAGTPGERYRAPKTRTRKRGGKR
jgi:prevent-host-death family protein